MVGKVLYIKYKEIVDGQIVEKVRYAVDRWQADDKYMGESFITFTVKSSKPIAFSVGDYCEYRGETYTLNYIPSVSQRANIGGSGEAFVYEQVKMDSPREELDRAIMLDVTPTTGDYIAALGTNYTGSAQFQLYCGETTANGRTLTPVCALAAKMQANLDRAFPDKGWKVLVDTTSTHEEAGQQVLNTHSDEKTLTFDNTTIANALAEVKNTFEIDFAVKGRTIYIGYTFGAITGNNDGDYYYFGYGKGYLSEDNQGKALFELKRTSDSGQKIVTRLRALGSTKNMPYRYYNKKYNLSQSLFPMNLQLPDTFETPEVKAKHNKERKAVYPWIRDVLGDTNDAYIDKNDNCLDTVEGLREDCMRWDGTNADLKEIYPSIEEVTYGELRAALCEDQDGNKGSSAFPHYGNNERVDEILDIDTDTNVGDGILTESDSTRQTASDTDVRLSSSETASSLVYMGSGYISKEKEVMNIPSQYAGNYIISNSHLWFRASYSLGRHQTETITKTCKVAYQIKVYAKDLSTNKESVICTYISDYKQISNRQAKEYEVEIAKLPDVDAEVQKVEKITVTNPSDIRITFALLVMDIDYSYDQWNVNWNLGLSLYQNPDTDTEWTPSLIWDLEGSASTFMKNPFHVYVKDMGFDFVAAFGTSDTPRIAMKSGMCVAREFEIGNNPQKVEYTKGGITYKAWRLTLAKAEDSSLKTYYPSENFPLAAGDNFVIIGIEMPDVYIQAASMKLLVEATKALADVCDTKHEYEPSVDGIYIQRNYDRCEEEGDVTKSVYWKLGAGMKFPFFGIAEEGKETPDMFSMIIDTLSIREGEGLTPNISIKLSEDFQQSTLQKLTRTVTSITNGSIFKATNIGNGGGLDESSVRAIVSEFTKRRFLSKLNPDTAAGIITFLQGTNWGNFTSETGAAMTVDPNTGQTYMEVDRLKVRLKAFFEQLEVQKVGYVGGKIVVSKGQGVDILDVEEIYDSEGNLSAYRCYFLGEQEGRRINNLLRVNDQMICKDENISEGSTDGATNKYYWRLVTAVSSDVVKRGNNVCHWVDLSATDCDTNSDIPEIGDTICHLGNREDTDRQGAEILSVVDANSPSFTIYSGINSYSLVNKEYIDMGVAGGKAFCNIYGSTYIGDRDRKSGYLRWNDDKKTFEIKGTIDITSPLSSGGTIGGAIDNAANAYKGEFDAFTSNVNEVIGGFQAQIDGVIETWFYDPEPTLGNLPASEWKDNTTKDKHLGDLYYSKSGLAYRFQKEGDIYKWVQIDDTAITSALKEAKAAKEAAAAAQGTADTAQTTAESKMKVFVQTPTNSDEYSVGDMWVNATYPADGSTYSNEILKCKEGKAAGAEFKIAHWEKASKYTDDTAAQEAQKKANEAATAAQEINASITAIDGNVDVALKDKIITKTEAASIKEALNGLDAIMADANKTKKELVNNAVYQNIASDVKTDYNTAYTSLVAAYNELSKYITDTLLVANPITDEILSTYTTKFSTFKTKYEDYVTELTVVRNSMDALLNTRIGDIATMLGGLKATTDAMNESTQINGGLILSSLLALGYTKNTVFNVMSGVSGLYESGETGGGIAFWAGGHRIDINNCTKNTDGTYSIGGKVVNPADFLVRHDGTGYAAGGKMWWDENGKIHADPQSFLINEEYVGNVMQLFKFEYSGGTEFTNIVHAIPQKPFESLSIGANGLTLYNGDKSAKFYIKDGVLFLDGDLAVTGGITMYASNGVTSGLLDQVYAILDSSKFEIENGVITIKGEIGDGKVKGATLGGVAVTLNANGILEFDAYPTTLPASDVYAWAKAATKPTYSWGEITEKPSSFTPSAHTHDDRYYTESEINTKLDLKLDTSLKGVANGLATLDSSGKVPSSQLPSYVDDVLECINKASFPATGESGKIYIDQTTNLTYRWGGSAYVEISQSLALGETSSTAYAGDKGKKNTEDIAALKTGKADKATTLSGYGITDAYTKTEVNTKLTDGSVTKIGTKDVGSATLPIYLKAGVPTAVGTSLAVDITGNSATATKLKTSRTLWGQSFDGSANVSGNMTGVGTITPTGNDLKVVGNLIVTGGIVMYADDGATIESGFAALLAAHIDGVTIKQNNQGKIYSVMTGIKVNGTTYKPSETDGYITIPDYPTSLDWENIENKPSTFTPASHTHTFASLTSKPTTLSGYGITDAKIANGVITLGTATITPLTAHQTVTLASGTNNGTLKLTVGNKTTDNIAVKGLGSAAYTASSAYAAASHTHSQYLVASSLDGYVNALTDNTSTNVFITAIAKSGKTLSYTKSFTKKSLTAASHSGWSSADTDKLIIPDMSFIAYWNGAYNSDGNSNLAYCNKGAFGDMATAAKSSYYTKSDTYSKTEVNTKLTDGSVTKLGTATVGSGTQHFYLNGGTATASTSTVGGTAKPMYLKSGVMTAISDTVGGTAKPIFLNAGTLTAISATVGSSSKPVYLNGGSVTACSYDFTSYLPLSGGTMGGTAWIVWPDSGNWGNNNSGVTFPVTRGGLHWVGQSDWVKLYSQETGSDNLNLVLQFGDDNSNGLSIRNNGGSQTAFISAAGHITAANGTVNGTLKVGTIPVTNSSTGVLKIDGNLIVTGGITMYATDGVASGLMEQILVDGTTIGKKADGTLYAINTGNVRSIIMGSTTYTPNDSGAVTLPEKVTWANIEGKPSTFTPSSHTHAISQITNLQATLDGKAAVGHTHSYLPLSGGTMTGVITGNTGNGLVVQSANTGSWKEGIRVYPASNSYALLSLQDSSSNNVFAMVTNVSSHTAYFDYKKDGDYKRIDMPFNSGTLALTSDLTAYLPLAGGTITGDLLAKSIQGKDNSNRIIFRHLDGQNCNGDYNLYLQYHQSSSVIYLNGSTYKIYNRGANYNGNAASATKLTSSAGSATLPIYFSDGKPVACTASSVFSNLSNSGNNISVTVAGQNRTLTVGYADTVDGYHASNIMQAGWIGLYRTGGSASTIKWTRIGRFITTANDNPNNDAMIEFFSNGDQNYTYFGHGRLMLSSYSTGSSNMMLTSVSDGSIHFYATIDANRYIWLGHNAWWTGSSKYRVLFTGSFVEWYSSSLTVQTTNPNDNYITDNGTFKYNAAMSTASSGSSHSWVWQYNSRVAYATSAGNSDTCDGLHVHGGRNNEANKIVRTDGSGYLQVGYINSSNGHEKNASSPTYVWGSNSSDSYLRSYQTSKLAVYTATKWATARKITLTGSVTGSVSIDGSGDVTLATTTNHTHSYLPLSGGTVNGNLAATGKVTFLNEAKLKMWNVTSTRNSNYGAEMVFVQTSIDSADPETTWPDKKRNDLFLQPKGGHVHIGPVETAQDYTCYVAGTLRATDTVTAPTFSGALSGNAATASKWATARTLTLTGSVTGSVSIDGSGNVSLATTTNHTHAYLPLAGGTMTGTIGVQSNVQNGGLKFNNNNANLNALNGQHLILGKAIRFGAYNTWDWNVWAGLKYDHANKTIYLGLADGTTFSANNAQSGGSLRFPGVSTVYATTFSGALSGNASTATNADKLDGVHYENILDRTFTKVSRISSAGWYRIAQTNTYNGHGASFILVINRLFNNNNNEAYTFSVNITYSGVAITQISGYANDTLIPKIRIDKPSGNNTCYVDIYYNSSSGNDVRYFTIGNAVCISATAKPTLVGTATEFSTSDGISTNKNILADGGITMHNTSDRRLKKNIRGFNACDELMKLGGVYQFEYIDEEIERNKIYKGSHIGLLYQNVKGTILDKMCFEREDGYGALNYLDTSFISLLAGVGVEHETRLRGIEGAFKKYESKTDKKIRLMKKKINELEKANESLEARVKELEERRTA